MIFGLALIFFVSLANSLENYTNESTSVETLSLEQPVLSKLQNNTQKLVHTKNLSINIDFKQNFFFKNDHYVINKNKNEFKLKNVINYIKVFHFNMKKIETLDTLFYFFVFIIILSSLLFTMTIITNKIKDSKTKNEKLREMRNYIRTYRDREFL